MNEYPHMHIFYLTGIKHSGKSKLGHGAMSILTRHVHTSFIDIDNLILNRISPNHRTVRDFYRAEGKARFMSEEYEALGQYLKSMDSSPSNSGQLFLLIATGGGACDNLKLVDLMHATGTVVYLHVNEQALFERILVDGIPPFLEGPDPSENFHRLFEERNAKYSNIADFMIQLSDSNTIEENSAILAERLLRFVS